MNRRWSVGASGREIAEQAAKGSRARGRTTGRAVRERSRGAVSASMG